MIRAALAIAAGCQALHLADLAVRGLAGHRAFAHNPGAVVSVLEALRDA